MSDISTQIGEIATAVTELRTKVEQKQDAVTSAEIKSIKDELKGELADLREAMARQNAPRHDTKDAKEASRELQAGLAEYFTKGAAALVETKNATLGQITTNGPAGGVLLPLIQDADITQVLYNNSVIRGLATVKNVGLNYVHYMKEAKVAAYTRAELGSITQGQVSTYASVQFGSVDINGSGAASVWALDGDADAMIDFAGEIRADILKGMAEQEAGQHMLGTIPNTMTSSAGSPTTVPNGLLSLATAAGATRFTNTIGELGVNTAAGGTYDGAAVQVGFDDLRTLKHSLHTAYRSAAVFLIGSDLEVELASIKDSYGRYLWALNDVAAGTPATILAQKYVVSDYMPDPAASGTAAGAVVALFGDFSKYVITQQASINWLVDPITDPRQVNYRARMRQGSCLTDFQAIRGLVKKSS